MEFPIRPLKGAGPIEFSMTQAQVRRALGSPHECFMKSAHSKMPTDSFLEDSIHVFYRESGVCEAVEFYQPSIVTLEGKRLLGVPYSEAKQFVIGIDREAKEDEDGFTSIALGVAAYAPAHIRDPQTLTESVFVFDIGYYDRNVFIF